MDWRASVQEVEGQVRGPVLAGDTQSGLQLLQGAVFQGIGLWQVQSPLYALQVFACGQVPAQGSRQGVRVRPASMDDVHCMQCRPLASQTWAALKPRLPAALDAQQHAFSFEASGHNDL